jgi:hypothetical protein
MGRPLSHKAAVAFFADLFGGEHHIPARGRPGEHGVHQYGHGWYVNSPHDMSTWDSDMLTRAVFLAHDRCMRLEVTAAGGYLRLAIHQRVRRAEAGDLPIMHGHPTLEEAVSFWRGVWPGNEGAPDA